MKFNHDSARSGWSPEETDLLFAEVTAAGDCGGSIKSAFEKVAQATGRKPNSIRNYYYFKIKENGSLARAAFVPFTQEETHALLRTMLIRQAAGKSVRGIAMELGGGDQKAMLRYQNKYRSMLRTNPQYVQSVIRELRGEGRACADPFHRRTRGKEEDQLLAQLSEALSQADIDAAALFTELLKLAQAAARKPAEEDTRAEELLKELSAAEHENMELRQRYGTLSAVSMNFINKNNPERIDGMNEYITEMQRIIG